MARRKLSKHQRNSKRYKKVTLFFVEHELCGFYNFSVPEVQLLSLKESIVNAGGHLEKETPKHLNYSFKGEGVILKVHELAVPYMYKH